jgi:hypothetical protein
MQVLLVSVQSGLSRVTSLAWKGDFLVFGDVEGIQCLWDLKAKISRYPTFLFFSP